MRYVGCFGLGTGEEGNALSEAPVPRRMAVRPVDWIFFITAEGGALPSMETI